MKTPEPLTRTDTLELAAPFGEFQYGDAQCDKRIAYAEAVIAARDAQWVAMLSEQEPVAVVQALPAGSDSPPMHWADLQNVPVGTALYAYPAAAQQEHIGAVTKEQRRLIGVIADKIEDGSLFQAGIFSRKELAAIVRNVLAVAPAQQDHAFGCHANAFGKCTCGAAQNPAPAQQEPDVTLTNEGDMPKIGCVNHDCALCKENAETFTRHDGHVKKNGKTNGDL